jgi:hypothetical protein
VSPPHPSRLFRDLVAESNFVENPGASAASAECQLERGDVREVKVRALAR